MKTKKKRLLTVELNVWTGGEITEKILASVDKKADHKTAERFHFVLSHNDKIVEDEILVSSSFELVKLKVLDVVREIIDSFDPTNTSIEIVEDSHSLLKKTTLYCPNCGRKLLESWGKAKGIVTKCHRCRIVCIPSMR